MVDTATSNNTAARTFTGLWQCTYWYPNNAGTGDDPSEYRMRSYQTGDTVVLESLPNEEKSYMLVRLHIDNDIATGNWHESTSPTGEFKGAIYSGAGQLMVDPATHRMEGQWAVAGYDHDEQKMRIYSGAWEIIPIEEK
jgi:hypothetical protein